MLAGAVNKTYQEEYQLRLTDYRHQALHYSTSSKEPEQNDEEKVISLEEEINSSGDDQKVSSESITEQPGKNSLPTQPSQTQPSSQTSLKHLFLTRARENQEIHPEDFDYYSYLCSKVREHQEKSDFVIIILIRLLFLLQHNTDRVNHIINSFNDFFFWPTSKNPSGSGGEDGERERMPSVIFWSENHTFMYLSTAYLLDQKIKQLNNNRTSTSTATSKPKSCVTEKDTKQLLGYLEAHCHFNGVYEVLSSTYLPYTLCSLLNLYDFSDDQMVRYQAHQLINRIVCSFTLVTNRSGIGNLTASSRQYPTTRLKNYGHNINQLIALVTGVSIDEFKPTSIVDFLLTTTWRPPLEAIQNFYLPDSYPPQEQEERKRGESEERQPNKGFFREKERMNHRTKEIRELYNISILGKIPPTPFFWFFTPLYPLLS
jgi:hypothetical protein